ncbi:SDR family oxidoreductase [Streptomyces sp. 6N223]|uniref:SDR family oxidoreductase n=1 Tax=Streptomyces sp. 6N223 TaxID=3457412 RepID=UPI003FCF50B3
MSTLAGRTALVTGGSRGIGRAIAERLGREGARVGVHFGRSETAAKETVAAIEAAGGSAFAVRAELGVPGDAEELWAAFDEHADGVDILVNNAGIASRQPGIAGTTPEEFDRLFAVNARAPFFVTKLALERLRDGGRIINLSTGLSTRGAMMPDLIAYTMTKSAIDAFTATLAQELGPRGITVNAVAPGAVDTDMNAHWLREEETQRSFAGSVPLRRVGQADDIAAVAAFLAGADGRWVTGQVVDASGGQFL